MTITKSSNFRLWIDKRHAKVRGQELADIFRPLNARDDADAVVDQALKEGWTGQKMLDYLKAGSEDIPVQKPGAAIPMPLPATVVPTFPPSEVFDAQPRRAKKTKGEKKKFNLLGFLKKEEGKSAEVVGEPAEVLMGEPPAQKKGLWKKLTGGKGKADQSRTVMDGTKRKSKKWLFVVVILIILDVGGYLMYTGKLGSILSGRGNPRTPSAETVPDQSLTEMSPEQKEAQANQLLGLQTTESTVKKPSSWTDFWTNFPWSYIFYFMGVPLMLLMTYRDRSQAREFSDVILAIIGVSVMTVAVLVSSFWPVGFDVGWTTGNVLLLLGFAIHITLQFGAFMTGHKDYTVLAMGSFVAGLLLRWWYIDNPLFNTIGLVFMIIGIIVQILEIKRNGKVGRSITGSVLAVLVFIGGYVLFFYLIQGQISLLGIQGLKEATLFVFWTKSQDFMSIVVGLIFAVVFGVIYGFVFLPTQGRDTGFDVQNLKILDADSQALGIMILYLLFPQISILKALIVGLLA